MSEEQRKFPNKWVSVLSYMTIFGWVIAIIAYLRDSNRNQTHAFHLRQSLGLTLSVLLISLIINVPLLGLIVFFIGCIFFFLLWAFGLKSALNGQTKEVPVLGEYYQKWFKSI